MKAILASAAFALAAFASAAPAGPPLRVATLNTVLAEVAREVGDDRVAVANLVQAGVDPHTFNPSPADIRTLVDADLVLASGLGLEGYLARLVASVGPTDRVIAVGDAVPLVLSLPRPGKPGEKDPHWWHSIDDMVFAVGFVAGEFARERPADADLFAQNALRYRHRLEALRAWVTVQVGVLPPARRQLVTSHDAFGYFAREFGFSIHAINGLSDDSEADARHLAALIDLIRRDNIRAIFAESSANPRLVANLVEETGARLGGTLYADGLGPPGSGADTYESMYRRNVRTIVSALSAP
jgi:zinc/manganese transport system substrate-binding protein